MWNNISSKIKAWFAIAKEWIIQRKEWVILGTASVLAVALIVGVILVLVNPDSGDDPVQNTTTGIQKESTEQTQQTTRGETTVPSVADETTVPDATDETDETDPTTESTDAETTPPTQSDPDENSGGSEGAGFTDQSPQGPSTSVTPSTPVVPEQTDPPPTETMAPEKPVQEYTYKEYIALSKEEKTKFFYKFPSLGDFNRWYTAAKKAYDEEKLVIGDSNIDLGELLNP